MALGKALYKMLDAVFVFVDFFGMKNHEKQRVFPIFQIFTPGSHVCVPVLIARCPDRGHTPNSSNFRCPGLH